VLPSLHHNHYSSSKQLSAHDSLINNQTNNIVTTSAQNKVRHLHQSIVQIPRPKTNNNGIHSSSTSSPSLVPVTNNTFSSE